MLTHVFRRNMSKIIVNKLLNNAEIAEKRLSELKNKLEEVRKIKVEDKVKELTRENNILSVKVQKAKAELTRLESLNGKKQYCIPGKTPASVDEFELLESAPKREKREKEPKKNKEKLNVLIQSVESIVDVRKLDFRIGKIIEINKHPDADTLYVEKIDCGEDKPRTVVSGLVRHVPIEEMREKTVMVLCNLKPVKMRGVTSEAMVMCASTPEKVEVLVPPSGATPGDLVTCEGYPREPEPQLNPKKKIFETCAPDLKTNEDGVACYNDSPLLIYGKGPIMAPSLKRVQIK